MFSIIEDTDIADDNAPYVGADNIDGVIKSLEEISEILFTWFNDNLWKLMLTNVIFKSECFKKTYSYKCVL